MNNFDSIDTPLSKGELIAYGIGGSTGKDLIMAMTTVYLLYFYTDILGISAYAAGTILFIARIWDGFNDPIVGIIVDKTRSRWGTYRPYLLIIPIPMAIFFVLTFTVPDLPDSEKIIWALVTYVITGMLYTAYDVPFWAMIPRLTTNNSSRSSLISITRISSLVSFLLVSAIALPLVSLLGGDDPAKGFLYLIIIMAILSVVAAWLGFKYTKERVPASVRVPQLKDYLYALSGNPTLLILLGLNTIPLFGLSIVSAMAIYGMTYWIGRPDLVSLFMVITIMGMIVGIAVTPFLTKIFGARLAIIGALLCVPIPMTGALLLGENNYIILMFMFFLSGILFGVQEVVIPLMIAKCSDNSSKQLGIRTDGIIFSLLTFTTKVGLALGAGVAGLALGWAGYVANSAEQTHQVITTISILWTVIPGALCFIGAMLMLRYVKEL